MLRKLLLCVAVALTLASAACGGGSEAPPAAPALAAPALASGPPVIVALPMSLSVWAGESARLSVVAKGEPPLRYQWRRNGVPIEGATSSSYVTQPLTPADDGAAFDVFVSNDRGTVPSAITWVYVRSAQNPLDPVAKLQRLANIIVALVDGARVTQNLFLAGRYAAKVPATTACPVSGAVDATLDGQAAVLGKELPASGRLDVNYTACRLSRDLFHDGRVALQYYFEPGNEDQLHYTADLADLTVLVGSEGTAEFSAWNVTLNGRIDAQGEIGPATSSAIGATSPATNFVFTPAAGTTVFSHATQRTARYLSGSYVAQGSSSYPYTTSVEFRELTFEIDGSTYVVSSTGPYTPAIVTRDGLPIGNFQLLPYFLTDEVVPGASQKDIDWF